MGTNPPLRARLIRPTLKLPEKKAPEQPQSPQEPKAQEPKAKDGEPFVYPDFWARGQLLNVRNAGSHYNVTVLGEEFDTRYPERCLQFPNSWECQAFISFWYSPQPQRFG